MSQNYTVIAPTQTLANSLQPLIDRDDAAASCFSGTAFPSTNLLLGMLCFRTDQLKLYQLTVVSPASWVLIFDLSSGVAFAPNATAVAWSGVSGRPTTISGYGITDALNKTGDTASGKIGFIAATAGGASVSIPHGVAPTSPAAGDIWSTTAGFFVNVNGTTGTVSLIEAAETYAGKKTFATGGTGAASANIPAGAAPTTPVDGDLWATTSQLVYRMAGVSKNVAFWDANSRIPVANGGTGAGDAATARTNLGAAAASHTHTTAQITGLGSLATLNTVGATQLGQSGSAPVYAARAWVNFNGGGTPAVVAGGNVSSITDNGTGDYTVNLTTAMADVNYAVTAMASSAATQAYFDARGDTTTLTTSTFRLNIHTQAGGVPVKVDPTTVYAMVIR